MENNINKNYNIDKNHEEHPFCKNCGKKGHIYKKCLYPIISLGIICFKINDNYFNFNEIINYSKKIQNNYLFSLEEINKLKSLFKILIKIDILNLNKMIKYLMIRRKHSLNYIEFIRGKYDLNNIEYLENIINLMSIEEKNKILLSDFNYLWKELWKDSKKNLNEFKNSKRKFDLLKNGTLIKKNDINIKTSINSLIENSLLNFKDPEWGFPKGRRDLKEKNIECAKREFQEETNFNENDYYILNMNPLEEVYLSTNLTKYKHIYYISQSNSKKKLIIDKNNHHMNREIGGIGWFNLEECLIKIRNYNISKKNKLIYLHETIKSSLENFKNILNDFLEFA